MTTTTATLTFTYESSSYTLTLGPDGFTLSQVITPDRLTAWAACAAIRDASIPQGLKPALRDSVEELAQAAMSCQDEERAKLMADVVLRTNHV